LGLLLHSKAWVVHPLEEDYSAIPQGIAIISSKIHGMMIFSTGRGTPVKPLHATW